MSRATLPQLDTPDTFFLGLAIKPCIALVGLWAADAALGFLVAVATRNVVATIVALPILASVAGVELVAFKTPRDGVPLTDWLLAGLHFHEAPRRWSVDAGEVGDGKQGVGLWEVPEAPLSRVLDVSGMDLDLRSEKEQAAVSQMWRRLVDGRDAPVTFVAAAQRIDMAGPIRAAVSAGVVDPTLWALADAYAGELERHHGAMYRRVQAVLTADDPRVLDAEELDLVRDLSAIGLVATRLDAPAPALRRALEAPRHIEVTPALPLTLSERSFVQTMLVSAWPREITPSWFQGLLTHRGLADVVVRIDPVAQEAAAKTLEKLTIAYESSLVVPSRKRLFGLSVALQDALAAAMEVVKGASRLHSVGVYVAAYGASAEELEAEADAVSRRARRLMLRLAPTTYRQRAGLATCLGRGPDALGNTKRMTSEALSCVLPFATGSFQGHPDTGVLLGSVVATGAPAMLDRFALPNHNMLILATSGAGKSFTAKLLCGRELLKGARVVVLDPEGEYAAATEELGGTVIHPKGAADVPVVPADFECLSLVRAGDDVPADEADREIARIAGEVLAAVWERIRTGDLRRTIVVVDEAFLSLVGNEKASWAAWSLVKRSRKHNASMVVVSQDVDDVLATPLGAAIIQNSAVTVLLKQHPNAEERMVRAFRLSEGEWQRLVSAPVGEALLIAGDERCLVRIEASPYEAAYCAKAKEAHSTVPA